MQYSIRLAIDRFELERVIGVGRVLVRTRAFIDGLKQRPAREGIEILDFDDDARKREQMIGGDSDVADLDEV